jgi:kynurenine formamidase
MSTSEQITTSAIPRLGAELLERPKMKLLDLSRQLYPGMPIWPGHQRAFMMVNQDHEGFKARLGTDVGFEAHNWLLSEHTGTHTDAILEYVPGGASLDDMPLEYFYGEGICIDVSQVRYPDFFTPEILSAALEASGQEIRPGDHVFLYTGHGERTFPSSEYIERYPGLDRAGATWLAEAGAINIAIDQVAIDQSDDLTFAGHMVCGEYNIINTENLTNLDELVGKRFLYMGLPIPFANGTGSPIRAVAWVQED